MWYASSWIPAKWLPNVLNSIVSSLPAIMSLREVRISVVEERKKEENELVEGEEDNPVTSNMANRHMWLSYWACWPILAVTTVAIHSLPDHHLIQKIPLVEVQ